MRFTVGQWVHVGRTVEAGYPWKPSKHGTGGMGRSRRRELWAHEAGWPAVVVGATRIKLGTRTEGFTGTGWNMAGDDYDAGEPPTFKATRTVLAYLVRRGMTNKAQRCLAQHLTPINAQVLPWRYNPDPGGHKSCKQYMIEHYAGPVEEALGGRCKYCNSIGYLQPWQCPPNAPKRVIGAPKPCPGCNPRGDQL